MADIPFRAPFLRHPDSDDSNRTQTDTYQFEEKQTHPHPHPPQGSFAREFSAGQQAWRLFGEQAPRLVITWVIVALMIVCLKVYQRDGNVSHHYKILFNTIITVLSLILGLNFLEVLKDMAKVLRWRILAAQPVTVREADLILGGDSLEKLFQLLWESRNKFWRGKFKWPKNILLMGCTFWIGLNFLAQASIALIGLNYSMDSGSNSNDTYLRPGTVLAAKLDCLYDDGNCPSGAPEANMTLAHTYGEMTRGRNVCSYASDANITAASQLCYYFSRTDGQEFAYRFSEYNPKDNTNAYPHLTHRNIRSTAGDCVEHALDTTSPPKFIDTPDGQHEAQVWSFGPPVSTNTPTYNSTITIPRPYAAFDSTTYIYNGTSSPDLTNATEGVECGARCLRIYAFRSAGVRSNRTSALFSCPITLSTVYNQTSSAQDIPDAIARLAASSIALSGRYTNPDTTSPNTKYWQQYQLYPWGSYWEAAELDARGVGGLMARFAMGSIAGMVELNPKVERPGLVPLVGYKLSVHWNFMIPLLCIIVGSHAILMLGILFVSRKIVVVDDSFFCVSRLVAPLMAQLGGNINGGGTGESLISLTSPRAAQKGAVGGSLLDRKEVAEAIQGGPARQARKDDGDERNIEHIVYGIANSRGHSKDNRISRRSSGGEMKTLVLGEDVSVIGDLKFQRFPGGLYA